MGAVIFHVETQKGNTTDGEVSHLFFVTVDFSVIVTSAQLVITAIFLAIQRMISLKIEVICRREVLFLFTFFFFALPGHQVVQ